MKRVTLQCAIAVALALTLGVAVAGVQAVAASSGQAAASVPVTHAQGAVTARSRKAPTAAKKVAARLDPPAHLGTVRATVARAAGDRKAAAGAGSHDVAVTARKGVQPDGRVALRLDNVFDPNFADGPEPLPEPQGYIEQSFGTDGEMSTAGAIALPITRHWAASVAFMHGTQDIFAYSAMPGAGESQRIVAQSGNLNFTAVHAQVMFRPNRHFTAVIGVTSTQSNVTLNPHSRINTINY